MDKHFFNDPDLLIQENKSNLTRDEILQIIPFDFTGKDNFISFYSRHNGVVFPRGAFFYRDFFYQVTSNDYNMLDIGAFFEISNSKNSIRSMWEAFKEDLRTNEVTDKYFPFGNDSSGNMYCIEERSGIVFYVQHENPNEMTEVAPSFLDFYSKIQGGMR